MGIVNVSLDPDRLTFVAREPDFDTPVDLEDEFACLIGLGFQNPHLTPEHLREASDPDRLPRRAKQRVEADRVS